MTRVEAIILKVEQLLTGAIGIGEGGAQQPITVYVDRSSPIERASCPAVSITANTEDCTAYGAPNHIGRETMRLTFRLDLNIFTRGEPPVLMAERNFDVLHQRLLADRTIGGLAVVRYANRRWQKASADEPASWLVASYDMTYTASDTDLA